jgi:hypothetical protein
LTGKSANRLFQKKIKTCRRCAICQPIVFSKQTRNKLKPRIFGALTPKTSQQSSLWQTYASFSPRLTIYKAKDMLGGRRNEVYNDEHRLSGQSN